MRLRGIYACHQPWYVNIMLALVRPFMSRKLRDRLKFFGSRQQDMLDAAGLRPEDVPELFGGAMQSWDPAWYLAGRISQHS